MKNTINLWSGATLSSEIEKQHFALAKSLIIWGGISSLTGILALIEIQEITFATFLFIFLQLFIKVSSVNIYESNNNLTVDKAIQKSELFSNVYVFITAVIFYIFFIEIFPSTSVVISLIMLIWSLSSFKK